MADDGDDVSTFTLGYNGEGWGGGLVIATNDGEGWLQLDTTHLVAVSTTALSQLMQQSALLMTQLIQKLVLMQF